MLDTQGGTFDQDYSLQVEQIKKYGCTKIFREKKSGKNPGRPELNKAREYLRAGDKLDVYKIDRLASSTRDLHNIVHELQEKNIGVVFIKEQIDFSTPAGKLIFTMSGAIAEFERDLINERTKEGRERFYLTVLTERFFSCIGSIYFWFPYP